MRQKLIIGIDIDGVIVDLVEAILPILCKESGRSVLKSDIYCFDIGVSLGITQANMCRIWKQVLDDGFYANAPPIKGAIDGLFGISQHDIWLVSSRPHEAIKQTENWLATHKVSYSHLQLATKDGAELAKRLGFDFFIEDNLDHALDIASAGVSALLFNHPWNQTASLPNNCQRVMTWKEIIEYSEVKWVEKTTCGFKAPYGGRHVKPVHKV